MPIYEYQCEACGNRLEKLQKLSDDHLKDCPECEQPRLKKLVSAAIFRLKGSGWYETDFKTGDKRNVSRDDSADSDSSKSADSGSSKSADSGSSKNAHSGSSNRAGSSAAKGGSSSSTSGRGSGKSGSTSGSSSN